MLHRNVLAGDNHIIHNWEVADATALAALVPVAGDDGKIAWQQDNDSFWVLVDYAAPTWKQLLSSASGATAASSVTIADAGTYYTGTEVEAALQEVGAALGSLDGRVDALEAIPTPVIPYDIYIACGDETTAITASASVAKVKFRVRRAFTLSSAFAELVTAQASGSIVTFDIKKNGTSIFSTLLTIDNTETDSATATTPAVLTGTISFVSGDIITIFITQCDAATAATGAKVTLTGVV